MIDRGREFLVTAELPGLRTQALDASVGKEGLRIVADFGDDEGPSLRRERARGAASRTIRLSEPVDENRVSASYDAGVLRVTLRKRRVEIR